MNTLAEFQKKHSVKQCGRWSKFEGGSRLTPAFPDPASRYDSFVFEPNTGDFDGIVLKGCFPYARYFSINIYDFDKGSPITLLTDRDIKPDTGSRNPFQGGVERNVHERRYTIYLVPEDVQGNTEIPQGNIIHYPKDAKKISVMTRVYRPDSGQSTLGGVDLPTIQAFAKSKSIRCPVTGLSIVDYWKKGKLFILNSDLIQSWNITRELLGNQIRFTRTDDSGLFGNLDNRYAVCPLVEAYENKVAVFKFKPPSFPQTYSNSESLADNTEVRYWSVCIGDLATTGTVDCLVDDEAKVDPQGYVNVVVSGDESLRHPARAHGYHYLTWKWTYKPIIIFRHMLDRPGWSGELKKIPALPRPLPRDYSYLDLQKGFGDNYIGHYSPNGRVLEADEFIRMLKTEKQP